MVAEIEVGERFPGFQEESLMRIARGTFVLVTDGRKMLLFRNGGDAEYPRLEALQKAETDDPPNREIKSDRAGRTTSSGGRRSAFVEFDFHREAESSFARSAGEMLQRRARNGEFEKLVVAADPRTLGELRRHYGKSVSSRLIGEIDKDLVRHPVAEIERILAAS